LTISSSRWDAEAGAEGLELVFVQLLLLMGDVLAFAASPMP
jgi:hypothetical protein